MTHHAASRKMTLTIFAISLIAMSLVLCTYLLLSQETVPAQPFSVGTIEPNQEWPGALFSIHSDDQTIAYIEHRKGEDFLYLKNRLGATELIKELGRGSQNIQLAWSPNGKNLLVTWRDEVTKMHLFEFDANSASFVQEQVIIHDVRYLLGRIAWLSNSQIALSRSLLSDSHYHLYTLSLDTMEYQLFNSEYFHGDPYYVRHLASQNGYLAFVQNKNKKSGKCYKGVF